MTPAGKENQLLFSDVLLAYLKAAGKSQRRLFSSFILSVLFFFNYFSGQDCISLWVQHSSQPNSCPARLGRATVDTAEQKLHSNPAAQRADFPGKRDTEKRKFRPQLKEATINHQYNPLNSKGEQGRARCLKFLCRSKPSRCFATITPQSFCFPKKLVQYFKRVVLELKVPASPCLQYCRARTKALVLRSTTGNILPQCLTDLQQKMQTSCKCFPSKFATNLKNKEETINLRLLVEWKT